MSPAPGPHLKGTSRGVSADAKRLNNDVEDIAFDIKHDPIDDGARIAAGQSSCERSQGAVDGTIWHVVCNVT